MVVGPLAGAGKPAQAVGGMIDNGLYVQASHMSNPRLELRRIPSGGF